MHISEHGNACSGVSLPLSTTTSHLRRESSSRSTKQVSVKRYRYADTNDTIEQLRLDYIAEPYSSEREVASSVHAITTSVFRVREPKERSLGSRLLPLCSAISRFLCEAARETCFFSSPVFPRGPCASRGEPVRGLRRVTRRNKKPQQGRESGTPLPTVKKPS